MQKKFYVYIAGVALLVAGGGVAASSAQAASGPEFERLDEQIATSELSDLTDISTFGDGGLDGPVIELATTDDAEYWAAEDSAGNLCVIVHPIGTDLIGSGCTPADKFNATGTGITLETGDLADVEFYKEVYLLPDNTQLKTNSSTSARVATSLTEVAPSLYVGDTRGSNLTELELVDSSGKATGDILQAIPGS